MKNLLNRANSHLLLILVAIIFFAVQGCKKDASSSSSSGPPVITGVRNYVPSPGDSLLTRVGTGKWVVITGSNLKGALQIYFNGVKGSFNDAWFSDTSAIVLMPAVIPFPLVEPSQLNTIRFVTTKGETTFSFPIVAPAPTISEISNESANPGDSVTIKGLNFFFIQRVSYAGVEVTGFKGANDGTVISMAVPASVSTPGPVIVTTKSGTATTFYNVHDFTTGVLNNYDGINTFSWGSDVSNSAVNFPGNNGNYGILKATNIPAGNGSWWEGGRSINTNAVQWVPTANLQDTLNKYSLKFEIAVKKPWTDGSIQIVKDYTFTYSAFYRPWKNANGSNGSFKTNGWQTVTVPLSNFLKNGLPSPTLTELLGSTGNGAINVTFTNDGSTVVTDFEAAIDNIRIVKTR
ncbi:MULTISPECIES: glycan-binding surface protein [unclassified Pedobacter]|uniref:glycan-binding surface protein n=1 Tax=unclassified Pedobacter TaxID=2628915 RepID=UPI001D1FE03C|nr:MULTISPECIES: glycan-binding surface protein [unclassified Pedobacter]CAH0304511.1 IPT/TIG domain-containing protein BACOVA_02650 [Pedobacter sp. Bi36]CAH0313620.1 IPT/TIG domain-containing protein BACOVA_02650 [Pedobacter sp. Bi126]